MDIDREAVMRVMRRSLARCIDRRTSEIDHTRLAEVAAEKLELYEDDDGTIPEELFAIAAEFDQTTAEAAGFLARATGASWRR
ncbi:hypothetical protein LZC95_19675 [Pendulispora brunnea]|uniref:Uncharacterized protein n=1 Tax=Pendulispora brunnea TaxID=2905690 RepID=A0ABZ2KK38_9BACT